MASEFQNLTKNNQQLKMQLKAYKDEEAVNVAQDREMYKIFIEGLKERQVINI